MSEEILEVFPGAGPLCGRYSYPGPYRRRRSHVRPARQRFRILSAPQPSQCLRLAPQGEPGISVIGRFNQQSVTPLADAEHRYTVGPMPLTPEIDPGSQIPRVLYR